jgi:autotransporter passenger strand-loop-strand repeat protein
MTNYIISSGQTSSGLTLGSGDTLEVLSGGSAIDTTLSAGGSETIYGSDSGATISSGGTQVVQSGGSTSGTTIDNGGTETVLSGGTAIATVISGGLMEIKPGGIFTDGLGSAIAITFSGPNGDLQIDGTTIPHNYIVGFNTGDIIDLPSLVFNGTSYVYLIRVASELSLLENGTSVGWLNVLPPSLPQAQSGFTISPDGNGGDEVIGAFIANPVIVPPNTSFDLSGGSYTVELGAGDYLSLQGGAGY